MLFAPSTICKVFFFTPLFIIRENAREVKAFSHFFEKLYGHAKHRATDVAVRNGINLAANAKGSLPQVRQAALLVLSGRHSASDDALL
jgi:hypothetical protein